MAKDTPASADSQKPDVPQNPEASEQSTADNKRMIQAAGIVGIMTILSRLLGLWRFRLLAHIFGATGIADAFNFAFIFPNLTRRLFGEGAMTSAFVPVFSEKLAKGQTDAANKTASVLICRLTWWLSFGCIALILASVAARKILPSMMPLEEHYILQLKLFELMLPYMVFINLAAVMMGVLNSLQHFLIPAFAPVLLNVAMILACYFWLPAFGTQPAEWIWAVAWAVLIGGAAQLLVQFPPAFARGFRLQVSMDKTDPGYVEVMDNFKPVVLMMTVFQANVLLDNIVAQVFISGTGPVTYLNMGTSIYQLPWAIFSLALAVAALPTLSKYWALNDTERFSRTLTSALRMAIYVAVPCTVGIVLLSDDIVRLLYGTGKFLEHDAEPVKRTAAVARMSTLGLTFYGVNALLARALYAMKDMRTPATTSAWSVALNVTLNLIFVLGLRMNESGIALASALSNAWQTYALAKVVWGNLKPSDQTRQTARRFFIQVGGALLVAITAAGGAYLYTSRRTDWEAFVPFFAAMAGALLPFWYLTKMFLFVQLGSNARQEEDHPHLHLGVEESKWREDLKFYHALYTTIMCSTVMGFLVWAVRDSLPPEGRSFPLVLQRAVVPVAAGIAIYFMASGMFLSREYEEIKAAVWARFAKRLSNAAGQS